MKLLIAFHEGLGDPGAREHPAWKSFRRWHSKLSERDRLATMVGPLWRTYKAAWDSCRRSRARR